MSEVMETREALHAFDIFKLNLAKTTQTDDKYLENLKKFQEFLANNSEKLDFTSPESLSSVYDYLYEGIKKYPELTGDILDTFDACVKIKKGNSNGAFMSACENLSYIYQERFNDVKKCMVIENSIMDNPENDGLFMGRFYSDTLLPLPSYNNIKSDDVRIYTTGILKKASLKDNVSADIVWCVQEFVQKDCIDSKDALNIIQNCASIERSENGRSIETLSYDVLKMIAKKNPELAPEIFKTYDAVINNCEPYLFRIKPEREALQAANEIEQILPEYKGRFYDVYKNRRSIQEINDERLRKINERRQPPKANDSKPETSGFLSRFMSHFKKR